MHRETLSRRTHSMHSEAESVSIGVDRFHTNASVVKEYINDDDDSDKEMKSRRRYEKDLSNEEERQASFLALSSGANDWTKAWSLYGPLSIITVLSFFTRFYGIEYPNETVFDEVHFGYFASSYIKGEFFFDIHPPFSKLLIAYFGWLGGYDGHFDFESVDPYDGDWYLWLRFLPALSGSLHAPLTYLTMREMNASKLSSTFTALLIVLETCMLMESRIIVTDAILMLFVIMSFYFHVRGKNMHENTISWIVNQFMCGLSLGACISTKWTALATMGVIGIDTFIHLIHRWKHQTNKQKFFTWTISLILLLLIPIVFYVVTNILHLHYLPNSGRGDVWMSREFRKNLNNARVPNFVEPKGLFASILELQSRMYINNKSIVDPHNWMAAWWSWPFMLKGIAFWANVMQDDPPMTRRTLYLLANPTIVWFSTAILLFFTIFVLRIPYRKSPLSEREYKYGIDGALLTMAYLFNWLPYILIARVTFIYHYMPSLYFSILLVGRTLDTYLPKNKKRTKVVYAALLAIFLATFLYHYPNIYATPLTKEERHERRWLASWV